LDPTGIFISQVSIHQPKQLASLPEFVWQKIRA